MADEKKTYTGDADIDECINMALEVMAPKNKDYSESHGAGDRLYNFKQVAEDMGLTKEVVLYVYIWKHMQAVKRYCREGKVDSEGIKGRIVDCINYLEILFKMVCENERAEEAKKEPPEAKPTDPFNVDERFWKEIDRISKEYPLPNPYEWAEERKCWQCGRPSLSCICINF